MNTRQRIAAQAALREETRAALERARANIAAARALLAKEGL